MEYPVIKGTAVDDTVFRRTVQAAASNANDRANG
jgi:hypothetical protein